MSLYQLMKKFDRFEWTPKAQDAFQELKAFLSTQPVLAAPRSKEPLLLYIAATSQVVIMVLIVEREEQGKAFKLQRLVYYISKVLTPSKKRFAAKKAIKSYALVDFLAEWIEQEKYVPSVPEHWMMFFDGSKMLRGSGAGVVLVSPKGNHLSYILKIHSESSNNEAEYEALLYELRMIISLGIRQLMVYVDFYLVVNQVMKEWDIRSPAMTSYCNAVRKLQKHFEGLELHHRPCLKNQVADDLAKMGSTRKLVPKNVFLEHLHSPMIKEDPFVEEPLRLVGPSNPIEVDIPAVIDLVQEILVITPEWTEPYLAYLLREELLEDEDEAR
ncbi:uncharacterized protein [Aegilops tauschii subsp. strangulata]|uniref:uncharacterized protein n=1 Tax=Aegilops tauschii subsp. strangulata TaxID=200361 RepID=UPI003CC87E77